VSLKSRGRFYAGCAFVFAFLAGAGVAKVCDKLQIPYDSVSGFVVLGAFFGSLFLMSKGVDRLDDEGHKRLLAKNCGCDSVSAFERDQQQRIEIATLGRAGELYWGLPTGTTLEEACRIKAADGDTTAQHYLRLIKEQRTLDEMFPARKSGGYVRA
jgi:hypothetical protein